MACIDPSNPAEIRQVYISGAVCNSRLLRISKQYCLYLPTQPRANIIGLRSPCSEYIKATLDAVAWKDPFGEGFAVTPTPIGSRVDIDLLERRFWRSGRIVASCGLDLSSMIAEEICLDLKDVANNNFGVLTIRVASSLATTNDAVGSARQAAGQLGPGPAVVNDAIQVIAPLATEITAQFNAWSPLLSRLATLVKVADTIAEIHPWIKVTWGVVSAVYRIPSAQSDRDAKVMALVEAMADTCSFADDAEGLEKRSKRDQDIVNQILRQVTECAYFIRDYCRDKSFAKRTVKYTVSLVDAQIDDYKGTLETLRRNLIDHANIECSVITHRVLDVVTEVHEWALLSEIKYASEANHDLDKGCLSGTRTEIIDTIVCWALGADMPSSDPSSPIMLNSNESSRVLWLCGTAGAGKSSILRSCAKRISDLDRLGSYYGFDKNKPQALNLTNLFSTIARDLADLDDSRKQWLFNAVKGNTALRRTANCKLQFQHFIIAPFKDNKALGETVIFIDTFDESGDVAARADALHILTKRASEFPPGLRVVITSRYEPDIHDALQSPLPPGVDVIRVDDIPTNQTSRDIATYVLDEFRGANEFREKYQTELRDLIRMAGTSFQWAATACRFIRMDNKAGVGPQDRIAAVLNSDVMLYKLYGTVMKEHCDPSVEIAVKRVKSILGRIICAQEPLSLQTLVHLVPPDSILTPDDMEIQRGIVRHLASLLSGTHSDYEPIAPLHSSYREFLCSPEHNKDFYIDKGEANQCMALACFRVMEKNLTFNICQISTSFLRNVAIRNIKGPLKEPIHSHLSYACRYWGFHVSATHTSEVAQKHMQSFFQQYFLHWLEVMSLTQSSPQTALASLSISHIATDLVELRHDAMQFISMFAAAIATSMPHIYLSGLTFAPASCLAYQRWEGQFPGVAKLAQGRLEHWPNIMLILEGHQQAVLSVAFSPDGKQIASGSSDKTVRLWNAETGVSIGKPMEGHDNHIWSIAFSPNGMQIASGSSDGTIRLWNMETGASVGQPMEGHDHAIRSIAFSHDGKQIVSGSQDKTIRLWNVERGVIIGQPIKGHADAVQSIAFSPDGKQIASGSLDKTIRLWNAEGGMSIGAPMEGHDGPIWSIAFSPDSKWIASGSWDKTIRLWNVETGTTIGKPMEGHDGAIWSIDFSPDGKQIASGSQDKSIRLWNAETGVGIGQPMEGHDGAIWSIAFSPDGEQIASSSLDKTVRLWNVEMGVSVGQAVESHENAVLSIAFSPDGKQIASGSQDRTIRLWNVETGVSIGQPMEGHNDAILSIAFSPDGKQIASGSQDKTIQLWNLEMGVSSGQPMEGHDDAIQSIAFSPDGKQIASGSWDRTIRLWNVDGGVSVGQPMKGHAAAVWSIAFSPDGKQIASGSWDKTVQIWDVERGVSIGQPMEGHDGAIWSIAFSPDGKQIASGSSDKTIRLWNVDRDVKAGQLMEGHNVTPWTIAFSPDGKWIASGSKHKTIQLWNAETGAKVGQPMEGHDGAIWSIAFSPDGKQIASGSSDKTIRLWKVMIDASNSQPIEGQCTIQSIDFTPDGNFPTWNNTVQVSQLPTPESKHISQYPVPLFPLPPCSFQIDNGWILGPSGELILWVPAAYRASLEHPHCRIMGTPNNTQIDFQHLKYGEEWAECQELAGEAQDVDGSRNM